MSRLFGTDGIRGKANKYPMTAEIAMRFAVAVGNYYRRPNHKNRVVIAKDTRLSGYLFEPALTAGFISAGIDVIVVGPLPTPAVSMLIKSLRADFGVMISASHNPYYDNGLKLFDSNGCKLSDTCEDKIQEMLLKPDISDFLTSPDKLGKAKRLIDASGRYIEHAKRAFTYGQDLCGLRIVVDCANGSAYRVAPNIFAELGAEIITIGTDPNGFNINDKCGSTNPETMIDKIIATRADIGIALDGDADRVVVADETGRKVDGDQLIAIIAKYLKQKGALNNDKVVVTELSNGALDRYLEGIGVEVVRTKVGDRYVFAKMQQIGASFGGEQSGHIICGDFATTGDGIVAALRVLSMMQEEGIKASEISKLFELDPQVMVNVRFKNQNPLANPELIEKVEIIKNQNPDHRILTRKSGTESLVRIVVEGKEYKYTNSIANQLENLVSDYCR